NYEERTVSTEVTNINTNFTTAVQQSRTFDTSVYKTGTAVDLAIGVTNNSSPTADQTKKVTSTWAGCIRERQTTPATTFTFVSLATGITPAAATDLDIDTAPTSDINTKWAPLWPEVTFDRDADVAYDDMDDSNPNNGDITSTEYNDNKPSSACPAKAKVLAE